MVNIKFRLTGKTERIDQPLLRVAAAVDQFVEHTGIDLSKILVGQTQIGGGQDVVKADKCMGVSRFILGGARARAAPQSTPMVEHHLGEQSSLG